MVSPLCQQTVTIYHPTPDGVTRQVVENSFYHWEDQAHNGAFSRKFLLVLPKEAEIAIGDRVLAGEGQPVTKAAWQGFVPARVLGLGEVNYITGYPTHTEAGRR